MFFLNRFPVCLNLFVFLFLVTPCLVVAVQPSMEWIPIKKKCLGASGIFSVVSLVRFLAFYIFSHCLFLFHYSQFMAWHRHALHSICQPQNKEIMLSTVLGFSIGKRITDHCSILVPEAVGFSQELLLPWVQRKS